MCARTGLLAAAIVVGSTTAWANEVPVETRTLAASTITLHLHPFLTDEELKTLRLVMTNEQALSLFVPEKQGYSGLAVSPEDGFIRVGAPMGSATAVGDLPDAQAARAAALKGCDAAKAGSSPCVMVLEIAPTR